MNGCSFSVLTSALLLAAGPRSPPDSVQQEWTTLHGTWTLLRMEAKGKSLLEKDKPAPKMVIRDGKMRWSPEGIFADADRSRILLDPGRRPKTIDIPNVLGPGLDVTLIGSYQLDGDELRVCLEMIETAMLKEWEKTRRPTTMDGSQGVLLVFKKVTTK